MSIANTYFCTGTVFANPRNNNQGSSDILCIPEGISVTSDVGSGILVRFSSASFGETNNPMEFEVDTAISCSFCETATDITEMIPGLETCPDGWELQYNGILMSKGADDNDISESICMAFAPETTPFDGPNTRKAVLFPANLLCENSCDDAFDSFDVPCVVCSK